MVAHCIAVDAQLPGDRWSGLSLLVEPDYAIDILGCQLVGDLPDPALLTRNGHTWLVAAGCQVGQDGIDVLLKVEAGFESCPFTSNHTSRVLRCSLLVV